MLRMTEQTAYLEIESGEPGDDIGWDVDALHGQGVHYDVNDLFRDRERVHNGLHPTGDRLVVCPAHQYFHNYTVDPQL